MLKKLYFHTHEGRSYDFDIVATAKVDKPGFTEWIVQVDTNNELGVHEVQASTDDCTFDVVSDDSLIIWKLPPIEEDNPIEPEPDEYEGLNLALTSGPSMSNPTRITSRTGASEERYVGQKTEASRF